MTYAGIVRRLLAGLVVLWMLSVMTFGMVHLIPGDPAHVVAGENPSPEQLAAIRTQLGLDRPAIIQYFDWLSQVVTGDLGTSLTSPRPVASTILDALPATLSLTLLALMLAIVFGISTGLMAGLHAGRWLDRALTMLTSVGIALPGFWVAMLIISLVAIQMEALPATGYVPINEGVDRWLQHIILPASALATTTTAQIARQTRGAVIDVLSEPYIRTARARGSSGVALVARHVLRNAAIPVVTVIGVQAGVLLGGVITVEMVGGINGLGTLALRAVQARDYTMIQGYVIFIGTVMVILNLLVDLSYQWINPKVRAK